jgi:transcriptional regulator GlxA family with amidase domain
VWKEEEQMQRVLFIVLPQVAVLDLAGPAQVFTTANAFGADYALSYHGLTREVPSAQGLSLVVNPTLPTPTRNDLVLVPGYADAHGGILPSAGVRRWLAQADQAGVQLASVCSGAFLLGHAGVLNGRRCTTHWSLTAALQQQVPQAQVQEAALFVHDAHVTTSAGIASGIDMALALLERQHGPLLTARVARELVVYLRRNGTAGQRSIYLEYRTHLDPAVHHVQDWLITHATEPVRLADLADVAGMSARHLVRSFKGATGLTPLGYQQRLRLELAAQLLQDPRLTLAAIAARCGFDDVRHFRRLWTAQHGQPPSHSRRHSAAIHG